MLLLGSSVRGGVVWIEGRLRLIERGTKQEVVVGCGEGDW